MLTLAGAEKFIRENISSVNTRYFPKFHAHPPIGWINDPNGFCFFRGEYHLFSQFYPYDSVWGPMHWGHYASKDLIHWEWRGVALAPDSPADAEGCFSGHAIVADDRLYLMYTGVSTDEALGPVQQQCMAVSEDGVHFEKFADNPVISARDLPENMLPADFRDPKVVRVEGGYRAIMAARSAEKGCQISYFTTDFHTWRCDGEFLSDLGDMPECPDRFDMDGKNCLVSCIIGTPQGEFSQRPNRQSIVFMTGECSGNGARFIPDPIQAIDRGIDFYAPQTLCAPDGRHIMIGWAHSWDCPWATHHLGHRWDGAMTLPREISLENGALVQKPLQEIRAFRGEAETKQGASVRLFSRPDACEYHVELRPAAGGIARVSLLKTDLGESFDVIFDAKTGVLTTSRANAGWPLTKDGSAEERPFSRAKIAMENGCVVLDIFVDNGMVEIFAENGKTVLTNVCFPKGSALYAEAEAVGGSVNCTAWPLNF